jgi:hypothetical protein
LLKQHNEKFEKVQNLDGFWPPTPGEMTQTWPILMGG